MKVTIGWFFCACFMWFSLQTPAQAEEPCGRLLDQIIIKFKTLHSMEASHMTAAWWQAFSRKNHLPVQSARPMVNGAYLVVINTQQMAYLSKSQGLSKEAYLHQIITHLRQQPDILYAVRDAEPCIPKQPKSTTQLLSPYLQAALISHASQWDQFQAPGGVVLETAPGLSDGAWSFTQGDPAIVLSNFEPINHNLDLAPNLLTGWNFHENNTNTTDPLDDHGTHTAGTLAASGSVRGITGMGPKLRILPIVTGSLSELIDAIYWSMGQSVPGVPDNQYPIKVASMSFFYPSITGCPTPLDEAFDAFIQYHGLIAVSAGNSDIEATNNPPRACKQTMVVAATDRNGLRANYSNYGTRVTLAAPGGEQTSGDPCDANGILSTVTQDTGCDTSGFAFYQGTSMATPHVAGIAGLLYSVNPSLTSEEAKNLLLKGVTPFPSSSDPERSCVGEKSCGAGIVNAYQSVALAVIPPPQTEALQLKPLFDPFNQCPANFYVPRAQSIDASAFHGVWIVNSATLACQPFNAYLSPTTSIQAGKLTATFGKVVYTFKRQ